MKTIFELDPAVRERAIAAYEENHGTPIDLSFAPDRAWIEGYVARQPLPPLDVEQMLKDCVPGGSSCDPQAIADEIRAWFARRSAGDPTRLAVPCVQPSAETRSARRWRLHWCGRTSATSGHGSGGR